MKALTQLVTSISSPDAALQQFTPILEAIDARLVFVIEDTDRNDKEFDQRQLQAMLNRLRRVERVSFVLTAGEKSEIDFPKVAELVEPIPVLSPDFSATLLARTLNDCTDARKWEFINPRLWFAEEGETKAAVSTIENEREPSMGLYAISSLLKTPRELKLVLRDLRRLWHLLKGEVDLYDLLCVVALQHCASPVFSFIVLHYREFPSIASQDSDEKHDKSRVDYLVSRLNLAIEQTTVDPQPLRTVLGKMVPVSLQPGVPHWLDYSEGKSWIFDARPLWPSFSNQTVFPTEPVCIGIGFLPGLQATEISRINRS